MKRDNKGLKDKLVLRRRALSYAMDGPCLEAYAGYGLLFEELYRQRFPVGIAFDKNRDKAAHLARSRPEWAVYESDPVPAFSARLHQDVPFSFVDIDPYGACWPLLTSLFHERQAFQDTVVIAVNDGLREHLKWGHGGDFGVPPEFWGSEYDQYLALCKILIEKKAEQIGYNLLRFEGFYAGYQNQMTHFYATLTKASSLTRGTA